MFDIVFIPYTWARDVRPRVLIAKIACVSPPANWEIPVLLDEYDSFPKEQGIILLISHKNPARVWRAYYHIPGERPPSPILQSRSNARFSPSESGGGEGEEQKDGILFKILLSMYSLYKRGKELIKK